MITRLAIFATHPVQYQTPLWRALAAKPDLDVTVYYFSDFSIRGAVDPGFGVKVAWDTPLLEGYRSEFISRNTDISKISSLRLPHAQELLQKERFDAVLIQGYMHPFERQIVRAAKTLGVKVLMRGEFADIRRRSVFQTVARRLYLKWFYAHISAFCYIGMEAKRHLLKFNISETCLSFSPYCVDTSLFEAQRKQFSRSLSRSRLGLKEGHFCFLFSGKLIPRKEPLLLLDALAKLPQRDKMALLVVGDGPLREQVVERGKAALGNRFLFHGFVNQSKLGEYYLAADAFVLPSNHETWGLVVNEAMQFGLPVIVSDRVGCHRDLVEDHETGSVFISGDVDSLAQALGKIACSPDTARRQGHNARKRILPFSTENSAMGVWRAINDESQANPA